MLSALGEPFRAEIDLLSYQDEPGAPLPRLSSPDLYRLVNFRYDAALTGAKLQLRRHANGRNFVEIAGERPLNEPVLYLLVELEHNATRIIRGYTVLLDPRGYGAPPASPSEFLPVIMPSAAPAAIAPVAPPPRAAAPAAVPVAAAPAASAADARQIKQLEEQLSANTQTLAGMLERVAAMEQMVKQLRAALEKPVPAAPPPGPAPAPAPAVQAPPPPAALPPRPQRSWSEAILNEALLILAGGALLLVLGLGYWMWGRAPVKSA